MSAANRAMVEKLRQKYAKTFQVPLAEVVYREWPDDEAQVWCPLRQDLPVWGTGIVSK